MTCTCSERDPSVNVRDADKDCPEHGLSVLADELEGLFLYEIDGVKVFARSQFDAEEFVARKRARRLH